MNHLYSVLIFSTVLGVAANANATGTPFNIKQQPMLGNPKAPISIVAVEEMRCDACGMYSRNLFPELKKRYIDTGIANYTTYIVSFIDGSMPAANAAYCVAEQNPRGFYNFIDAAYQNHLSEYDNWATLPNLRKLAVEASPHIDVHQFEYCLQSKKYYRRVESNINKVEAATAGDGVSTPTLFINGKPLRRMSLSRIRQAIAEATT